MSRICYYRNGKQDPTGEHANLALRTSTRQTFVVARADDRQLDIFQTGGKNILGILKQRIEGREMVVDRGCVDQGCCGQLSDTLVVENNRKQLRWNN